MGQPDQVGGKLKPQARMLGERGQPMNLVQFKRHDGDGDVFINPAHVAMVEPSTVGDGNGTDVVVAAQAGLALVRVREPIKDVVDKLRRETPGSTSTSRRAKKTPRTSAD